MRNQKETTASKNTSSVEAFSAATRAGKILFTSPRLFIPVIMQLCFMWGTAFFGLLVLGTFGNLVYTTTSAFGILVQGVQTPQLFTDSTSMWQALNAGFFSTEMLGLFIIVVIFITIGMLLTAYSKALVLGAFASAREKKSFVEMFKRARGYWKSLIVYYAPFLVLGLIIMATFVYLIAGMTMYSLNFGGAPQMSYAAYIVAALALFALVLRIITIYADGIIVNGSTKPYRDSASYLQRNKKLSVIVIVSVIVLGAIMYGISAWLGQYKHATAFTVIDVLTLILFVLWRLFVAAYSVELVPRTSPEQRKTRA